MTLVKFLHRMFFKRLEASPKAWMCYAEGHGKWAAFISQEFEFKLNFLNFWSLKTHRSGSGYGFKTKHRSRIQIIRRRSHGL
jgi:hypothetical protein